MSYERKSFPKGSWQAEAHARGRRFGEPKTNPNEIERLEQYIQAQKDSHSGSELANPGAVPEELGTTAVGQSVDQPPLTEV